MTRNNRLRPARARIVREYVLATLATITAFALAFAVQGRVSVANLSMIFLTAVIAVAVRTRMSVAVYTAVACFLGYNFFFTPPRYTLAIADTDDLLAVSLFLIAALICSRLATQLARRVASLRLAQERARVLRHLSQRLAASSDAQAIAAATAEAMAQALDAQVVILLADADGHLRPAAMAPLHAEPTADQLDAGARIAVATQLAAIDPHDARRGWLSLRVDQRVLGVVTWRMHAPRATADVDPGGLAQTMARDAALALERARLAVALEQARVQGETESLRNALLSSVSHDLRSPLVSMIGSAGTLAAYEAQLSIEERRDLLKAIVDEGQRMDRYIQNLLDMARLGHGELQLRRDWVDASEIVLAALARLRRVFPELAVDVQLPADTVLLYVHPALIEQALFNILENAAQFSPPARPVHVRVEIDSEAACLRIEVSDHGPGIPEHERQRIFDTFHSVARGDRGHRGTGLGLSICRGMIGAHGGTVEALSGAGGGTTMRVTLPLPPAPESAP